MNVKETQENSYCFRLIALIGNFSLNLKLACFLTEDAKGSSFICNSSVAAGIPFERNLDISNLIFEMSYFSFYLSTLTFF